MPRAPHVLDHWCFVIAAGKFDHPTKTGIVDVLVVLDVPWLKSMMKILPFLARARSPTLRDTEHPLPLHLAPTTTGDANCYEL